MWRPLVFCVALVGASMVGAVSAARAQDYTAATGYPPPELEPRPKNGIAAIIVGSVLLGGAAESLVLIAACGTKFDAWDSMKGCRVFSGALAGVSLAIGVPALVLGIKRRQRYKEWRKTRPRGAALFEHLTPTSLPGGAGLSFGTSF